MVRFKRMRFIKIFALLLGLLVWASSSAWAQGVTLIRDAEIEHSVRTFATPLFQAAGLNPSRLEIFLIEDDTLNAFVVPGGRMFLNTGLILRTEDPTQLMGVIAHETGHIAAGHTFSRGDQMENAMLKAIAGALLGLGAGLATGDSGAAAAGSIIGQDMAMRGLLSFTRGQENSADQSAIRYMRSAGYSPKGLLDFMEIMQDQEALLSSSQEPYMRTHPLTRNRVRALEHAVEAHPGEDEQLDPELARLHARMRAKLSGFLESEREVMRRYPESDTSVPARYARAISHYRNGRLDSALDGMDRLLEEHPNDAFFHEMRGQMLLENGRLQEALEDYQTATNLQPEEPLIRLTLAQVQTQLNRPELDQAALDNLAKVRARESDNPTAWRLTAIAHGRLGDKGRAALALAEMNYARASWNEAVGQAERAKKLLDKNTPAWLRASDLSEAAAREADQQN
ncbi:M48 family metalloprotease [Fodinicurvata fenggangensis]|uniref:M48 family metalloprotease n=1 Tax=Fodinicurvata fenggangensis TaxID=1121830 RepID=UPI00138E092E|nr:M48 family metalloprotease [Fodinicurvata fenggangensis]